MDKKFELIRFKHDPLNDIILKALEYVKSFIIKHNLIIVGGFSIDASMRLKNKKLYEDTQIPDYDVYCPEHSRIAYLLGSELCDQKYPNVDVITAIHTTTMRVRVESRTLLDCTFYPLKIFEKLPTLEYKGMKIIHPHMVNYDQFRSLSMPYENSPQYNIFHRWEKDITRMKMLLELYPFEYKKVKFESHRVNMPKDGIIHGWGALAYHLKDHGNEFDWKGTSALLPVKYCSIITDDIHSWIKKLEKEKEKIKYYNELISYPRHIKSNNFEIFDFWGQRITIEPETNIASIATTMHYFLHCWLLRKDELALMGIQKLEPLLKLSITPYGKQDWNTSTLFNIANIVDHERVKNWKPPSQSFSDDCLVTRKFDHHKSPLFAIDESECEKFEDIVDHNVLSFK